MTISINSDTLNYKICWLGEAEKRGRKARPERCQPGRKTSDAHRDPRGLSVARVRRQAEQGGRGLDGSTVSGTSSQERDTHHFPLEEKNAVSLDKSASAPVTTI